MEPVQTFDPAAFMNLGTDQEGSLVVIPIPVGEWLSTISKVIGRPWKSKDGTKSGIALDLTYDIDSPQVKELLGRPQVTITQGIMLDMTENGALDMGPGKNAQLNRVREACGLNKPGVPFAFFMFAGKVVKVVVGHRPSERPNDPPGTVFSDVNNVVKAA